MKIRTRFAPSPTGYLHIGSLRTALFCYLFAKKHGGVFILRIEDTDRERYVPDAVEKLIQTLDDFGLHPGEGPTTEKSKGKSQKHALNEVEGSKVEEKGKFGPYVQSERLSIYKKYAEQLIGEGKAYYCFCPAERLEQVKKQQQAQNLPPRYDGHCRDCGMEEMNKKLKSGDPHVIRQKMPRTGLTEYDDLVYGHLQFRNDLLDDSILIKSDGYPVYNFANVVDDHLMEISHVIRGEEFLSSTPKHVLLYRAFGWEPPVFAHLPLILDTKRQKLSKRSGDVAVEEYVKKGYYKEALLNFIALLGWNPKTKEEIFSLEELVENFSFDKVNKSGAIFDVTKLEYINREWRKRLKLKPEDDPVFERFNLAKMDFLGGAVEVSGVAATSSAAWGQITERMTELSKTDEIAKEFASYDKLPEYEGRLLLWKAQKPEEAKKILKELKDFIQKFSDADFKKEKLEESVKEFLQGRGVGLGEALWPLRAALSGQKNSPSPFEIMDAFAAAGKKQEIFNRIDKALKKLG